MSTGSARPPIAPASPASQAARRGRGLRQVVTGEPEPPAPGEFTGVVGEHHHAAGHALHLAQPGDRVLPVVDGAEGHRGVEGLVGERQALRGGGHARRRALGRCARMTADGSTAVTSRPGGS